MDSKPGTDRQDEKDKPAVSIRPSELHLDLQRVEGHKLSKSDEEILVVEINKRAGKLSLKEPKSEPLRHRA